MKCKSYDMSHHFKNRQLLKPIQDNAIHSTEQLFLFLKKSTTPSSNPYVPLSDQDIRIHYSA